ncbi:MAG TPA: PQQ-binding-like beta-propeller repeat protein [Gaiellaceae bacterium]|jgi:outer membrane protein assembly factor BamB|nr:PQQ-binding-like beta-propeller repeat protein [Gaiellaceae bacterium]
MRRASLLAVFACLALGALAGCGGGSKQVATSTTEPTTTKPRPRPVPRPSAALVTVRVVDGDTGKPLPDASVTIRGAVRRTRVAFAMRTPRFANVALWTPGYGARTIAVPFGKRPHVVLRLYRRDGQWPMYGADPARSQSAPAGIRLRPPFRIAWARSLGGLVEFPAVVSDGIAYVDNYYGTVSALSMASGRTLWRRSMGATREASSPAVDGGTVVAHSRGGRVFVFDRISGKQLWTWPTAGQIESSPVVVDGVDYFGDAAGNIYALDLRTHRLRWRYGDGCKITASAAVVGGTVYLGDYCGRLVALRAATGSLRFAVSAGTPVYGTSAVANGRVFVPSRDSGALVAFTTSGHELWSVSTGAYVYGAPAVAGGRVFFGSYNGTLYCVSAATGRIQWTAYAGGSISGSPTVVDGIVYAGSFGHRIIGVNAATGRKVFTFPHGEYVPVSGNAGRLLLHGFSTIWAVEPRR